MNKLTLTKYFTVVLFIIIGLSSCKKEEPLPDNTPPTTFREVIDKGGDFDPVTISEGVSDETFFSDMDDTYIYDCSTATYSANAESGGSDGFPLFDIASDIIYPGSMLQGNSLTSGNPNPIVVERAGGVISTNILDGNLQSSFEVEKVSKSSITDAMNNIISTSTGTLPSNFSLKIVDIKSREQFALEMGMEVNSTFADLEANLNYSYDVSKNSFLVSLNQSYYTMSFDLPTSLDALFAPEVTPEDLAPYVGPSNPATYISSVTYGRIFYMLITSTSSKAEMEIEIDAAFRAVVTSGTAGLNVNTLSNLDNITYDVFAYGGDAQPTFDAIAQTDVSQIINMLGQSSTLGSGKPLSYVVRSVKDNSTVATQLATSYTTTNCDIVGAVGTIPSITHWSGNPLFDNFGAITAINHEGGNQFSLYNESGEYLLSDFQNGEGKLIGPFSLGSNFPLNSVGAACKIYGPNDDQLAIFDITGTSYTLFFENTNTYGPVYNVQDFYSNSTGTTVPFAITGIGALAFASESPSYDWRNILFSSNGLNYAWFYGINGVGNSSYSPTYSVLADWSGGILNGKIDEVGAATGFALNSNGSHYYIMFNKAGDKFILYGDINGSGTQVVGPFII